MGAADGSDPCDGCRRNGRCRGDNSWRQHRNRGEPRQYGDNAHGLPDDALPAGGRQPGDRLGGRLRVHPVEPP